MNLYKVKYKKLEMKDGDGGWSWGDQKEGFILAPSASVVCREFEEKDDTEFDSVELVQSGIRELED